MGVLLAGRFDGNAHADALTPMKRGRNLHEAIELAILNPELWGLIISDEIATREDFLRAMASCTKKR
jgi:hypothetical protein